MSTQKIKQLFDQYLALVEKDDAEGCGDLARNLDDETCKQLYDLLVQDDRTKDYLVKTLWYNYDTQKFRWEQ